MAQNRKSNNARLIEVPGSTEEWALYMANRGVPVISLHHTNPDGTCTCGRPSKPADPATRVKGVDYCGSQGKHPTADAWQTTATTDAATVRGWFKHEPKMNYGCVAGAERFILDIDVKGADGYATAERLLGVDRGELDSMTFSVKTPSGGEHLYFGADKVYSNSVKRALGEGLDTRSGNGFVVGPGSVLHMPEDFGPDMVPIPYSIVNLAPALAPLPDAIKSRMREAMERADDAHAVLWPDSIDSEDNIYRAREYLKNRDEAVIGQGGDEQTLVTAMGVRDYNISEDKCYDLMLELFNDRLAEPWDPDELRVKVRNGYLYAKRPMGTKRAMTMEDEASAKSSAPATDDSDFGRVLTKDEKLAHIDKLIKAGDKDIGTAIKTTPLPEYFLDGMLAYGGLNMILGDRGSGKTTVCLDIMLHIAHGMRWQDVQVDPDIVVIYFSLEDPQGAMLRVNAWYVHMNRFGDSMAFSPRFRLYQEHIDAFDSSVDMRAFFLRYMEKATDSVAALGKPRKVVVVLDTWQRFTSGAPSQSDEEFMNRAFDALEFSVWDFSKKFQGAKAGAVGIFHPSKTGSTASGAYQLENRSVGILTVVQGKTKDKPPRPTGQRYVEDTRNKNGPEGSRIEFTIKGVALPGKNNFGKHYSGAVLEAKAAVKSAEVRKAEVEKRTASVASSVAYNVYRMMEALSLKPGTTVNMVASRIERDAKEVVKQRKLGGAKKAEMALPVIPWKPVPGSETVSTSVEEWPTSRSSAITRIMQLAGAGPVHVAETPFMLELVEAPLTGSMTVVYRQMDDDERAVFGQGLNRLQNS